MISVMDLQKWCASSCVWRLLWNFANKHFGRFLEVITRINFWMLLIQGTYPWSFEMNNCIGLVWYCSQWAHFSQNSCFEMHLHSAPYHTWIYLFGGSILVISQRTSGILGRNVWLPSAWWMFIFRQGPLEGPTNCQGITYVFVCKLSISWAKFFGVNVNSSISKVKMQRIL